jgi:hypothetical protein
VDRHRVTVAITVRPEVLAAARHQVAQGHAASLSAWIEQAMEEMAGRGELVALLAGMPAAARRPADIALAAEAEPAEDAPSLKVAAPATPLPRRGRQVV